MVCLDTAFLADLFRKNPAAEMKLKEFVDAREEISITVMTVAELYYGAYKSNRLEEEKAKAQHQRNVIDLTARLKLAIQELPETANRANRHKQFKKKH